MKLQRINLLLLGMFFMFHYNTYSESIHTNKMLPRNTNPGKQISEAVTHYLDAVKNANQDIHSLMIVQHGKVVAEKWLGNHTPTEPHAMYSVSKTFTATAVGFAIQEGKLKLTDKVISFFPEYLPSPVSQNLKDLDIKHLLTMSGGHDTDPTGAIRGQSEPGSWEKSFLATPFPHRPGTCFVYNSMGTYMLSAIVQKVTGQKLQDYLTPRLFQPLGITNVVWEESPSGVNCGGWGLLITTEDMAKMGQFILQKGMWHENRLLQASWFDEATSYQVASLPAGAKKENLTMKPEDSDWLQGYGFQMWRCRHNAYRADGANGQFIIIIPEKDAVIVTTANVGDMQGEINLIWKYLLPALN